MVARFSKLAAISLMSAGTLAACATQGSAPDPIATRSLTSPSTPSAEWVDVLSSHQAWILRDEYAANAGKTADLIVLDDGRDSFDFTSPAFRALSVDETAKLLSPASLEALEVFPLALADDSEAQKVTLGFLATNAQEPEVLLETFDFAIADLADNPVLRGINLRPPVETNQASTTFYIFPKTLNDDQRQALRSTSLLSATVEDSDNATSPEADAEAQVLAVEPAAGPNEGSGFLGIFSNTGSSSLAQRDENARGRGGSDDNDRGGNDSGGGGNDNASESSGPDSDRGGDTTNDAPEVDRGGGGTSIRSE